MKLNTTANSNNAIVNLIVALDCEARVLIDAYRLKKIERSPFSLYQNQSGNLRVIVSGIGQIRTAAATAYLASQANSAHAYYLNLGIAGAAEAELGGLYYAHQIQHQQSGQSLYPHKPKSISLPSAALITLNAVQDSYPEKAMIDLEAAAFYTAASLWVPEGQVHVVKLISDRNLTERDAITKSLVIDWMHAQKAAIIDLIEALQTLSAQEYHYQATINIDNWLATWHFSQYQQHELKEYLRRWQQHGQGEAKTILADCSDAKAVLQQFRLLLKEQEYTWP